MSKLEQIISVHLGQAGLQMASAFWELMCIDQGVSPDGKAIVLDETMSEYENVGCLFEPGNRGSFVPRSILLDSEPNVLEEIKTGAYRNLFRHDMMHHDSEDAANNYARGSFTIGKKMIKKIIEIFRKTVERTENLKSFFMFNSSGGGTGSGVSPLILLDLMMDYPKIPKLLFSVAPGSNNIAAIVEPYNNMLHAYASGESVDVNFLFENESIFNICCKKLLFNCPSFLEINRVLAMITNSIIGPMRYSNTLRSSIDEILTNLIPYSRIHYPIVRYAPVKHTSKTIYDNLMTKDLTKELFSKDNQSINVDTRRGLFIAMTINYQGLVSPGEVYRSINKEKTSGDIKFVEWCPTGFKFGISNQLPTSSPMTQLSPTDKSASMLMNTTAISEFFMVQLRKFDLLFERRAFVHWYIGEGMEELDFVISRDECEMLAGDYEEIRMSDNDLESMMVKSKSHHFSTVTRTQTNIF